MKKSWIAAPLGAGIGAAVMYLFDPERGKRRRALVRDKFAHATRASAQRAGVASRDVANHLRGAIARARSKVTSKSVPDSVLAERVRAQIGHVIPHAGSIDVTVRDGRVTLAGPTVEGNLDALLSEIARVRGVAGIDNRLGVPEEPHGASELPAPAPSAAFPVERRRGEDVTTVS
ncbi:MAG TPA: BON domain-containing protein [Thermoanaerobaculia bacterium]|nr:BON domain-containing protein [Thermoanaerobaculia bacterium]